MEVSLEPNYFWYQCLRSKKKNNKKHDQENEPISEE